MGAAATRRFYKSARALAVETGGFRVELDGRPLLSPARIPLVLPGPALAEAVAAEWQEQGPDLRPAAMPLTAIAFSALDLVGPRRAGTIESLAAYAGHELCCYRVQEPAELAARQQALWQPLLDWVSLAYDAPLRTTSGLAHLEQSPSALKALRRALEAVDDFRLSALSVAVAASGSLVIALALAAGRLDPDGAFAAAELEESYAIERWGEDEEAAARRAGIRAELAAARRFLDLYAAG